MPVLPVPTRYSTYFKKTLSSDDSSSQTYLELILSFAAVAFFGWFALRPTITTIVDLLTEIDDKQEIVSKLDQKIDALVAADTTYKSVESQLPLLDEALPTDHQVAQFTSQIETLAQESGVNLVKFNYHPFPLSKDTKLETTRSRASSRASGGSSTGAPAWKSLQFEIEVSGEYPQFRQLVAQLYQLRRLVLINSLSLQQQTRRLTTGLTLKLSGQVLYL